MTTMWATGSDTGRRDGFTLMELSVVVFIVAILLAVSAPRFVRSYNSALVGEMARTFATTCQFARIQAVSQQREAVVHVDAAGQKFWLTQFDRGVDGGEPEEQTLKVVEMSPRVRMVAANEVDQGFAVVFYPNGTCDAATVVFRGTEPGSGVSVTLDPITTKAEVTAVKL